MRITLNSKPFKQTIRLKITQQKVEDMSDDDIPDTIETLGLLAKEMRNINQRIYSSKA